MSKLLQRPVTQRWQFVVNNTAEYINIVGKMFKLDLNSWQDCSRNIVCQSRIFIVQSTLRSRATFTLKSNTKTLCVKNL